ncbi:uncharacterized protein [Rutidosis leptorrhynchoides]|uniref:uncharacterized protein n=1 Tax=Rutidosis leptorrhynchoides TaxID=125765 RepID=UPI003A9A443A
MIVTFDLTSEKIGEVYLPDNLAHSSRLFLSKRMEFLAVIDDHVEGNQRVRDVWIMNHDVPNSYEKLFTFKAQKGSSDRVLGFRKNGDPILLRSTPSEGDIIEVYNSSSQQFTEVFRSGGSMKGVTVDSFMETLFLIDQPNKIVIIDDDDDDDDDNDVDDDDDGYVDDDYDDDDNNDAYDDHDDAKNDDIDNDGKNDDGDDVVLPLIDIFQVN